MSNNINVLARQAKYFEKLLNSRAAARNAVNVRGNPIKTRKNRRHGGGNNNINVLARQAKYFEKLMNSRAATRNAVNVRGNPIKSRKNRSRKNRKASRKDRKTRH
jgi:hypothetical protein